jgi:hypothetical protein
MHAHRPQLDDVFACIDQQRATFIDRLIEYLRHPHGSAYGDGMSWDRKRCCPTLP